MLLDIDFSVIIPARYHSTRLPAKPLLPLHGVPMVVRTWQQCIKAVDRDNVYVATDSEEIRSVCEEYGIQVIMTSEECMTGTDRVAEVATKINSSIFINVQGDEPVLNPEDLKKVVDISLKNPDEIINGACLISSESQFRDFKIPKVVMNKDNKLLYMSRGPIPANKTNRFIKAWRQICIYAFPRSALEDFSNCQSKTPLEEIEDIEIIRFLELGWEVRMVELSDQSISLDSPEDVLLIENAIIERGL